MSGLPPPSIFKALGHFDLDPCSPIDRPWDIADSHFTVNDNGMMLPWRGRVWCNPPYGKETGKWLEKLAMHGNGIALVFARTETRMFFDYVWNNADALFFIKGRLKFYHVNGIEGDSAGAPSVLIAYGKNNSEVLKNCKLKGKYIELK
ncbi:DNA N-6-adenine-methyltransferase [Galbibacter sp. BG1]